MTHNKPRYLTRILPFGTLVLFMAVSLPAQALPLGGLGVDLGVNTPVGPVSVASQGTNAQIQTPASYTDVAIDGTYVSACTEAFAPMLPFAVSADLCAEADAQQQIDDIQSEAQSHVERALSTIGGLLKGLF